VNYLFFTESTLFLSAALLFSLLPDSGFEDMLSPAFSFTLSSDIFLEAVPFEPLL